MKKKVLLLDTSFSAKPIYEYLKNTGFIVYVVGGNPEAVLAKTAENFINIDYSNYVNIIELIKALGIDYLVPGGNDLSYKICSQISEKLDFYNIDPVKTNEIISNKEKFRKFAIDLNLHVPRLIEGDNIRNNLPVIVKPVDAYAGSGITKIHSNNIEALDDAIKYAKKCSGSGKFLIEEFVEGQLYSHSAFISNEKILIDFIVEEHCIGTTYAVDTSYVDYNFDPKLLDKVRRDILKLVQELNLADGLIHTQFICNGSEFWLIEITRRCPGDLYSDLIEFSTDFPYVEYYVRPFLNKEMRHPEQQISKKLLFRHTITQSNADYFNSFHFNVPAKVEKLIPLASTGAKITGNAVSRIGLAFIGAVSRSEFDNLVKKSLDQTLYKLH